MTITTINASNQSDVILGTESSDFISGLAGDDSLTGGQGNDTLLGGRDADIIDGGANNDLIMGDHGWDSAGGHDSMTGGEGDDRIFGYFGDDILAGNEGYDRLWGGAGADIFDFNTLTDSIKGNSDRIEDFQDGIDHIDLTGLGFTAITAGSASGSTLGHHYQANLNLTILEDDNNFEIRLLGNIALDQTDFIF